MSRKEINDAIVSLAHSRGFYGRVIAGYYGDYEEILDWLYETICPKDTLDIVYALES
jgi:hypothetical protein